MSNKQQTAVEWIEYQVQQQGITHYFSLREILEQAKAMEKEQIVKGVNFGTNQWGGWGVLNGEEYYKKTYGGNK
jgi:hypothetical protein